MDKDLQSIFKFQLVEGHEFVPKDTVEYMLFSGQDRILKTHKADDLDSLQPLLEGYEFEGYRDRTPLFVKPEL